MFIDEQYCYVRVRYCEFELKQILVTFVGSGCGAIGIGSAMQIPWFVSCRQQFLWTLIKSIL